MSFIAVGGTLLVGGEIGAGTVALGAGLAGAGLNLIGANKQAQSVKDTNATNQAAVDKANNQEWNNYLLQRGINTGGTAAYGSIPTNAAPVNTRLPLWANINLVPTSGPGSPSMAGPLTVRRKGGAAAPVFSPGGTRSGVDPVVPNPN